MSAQVLANRADVKRIINRKHGLKHINYRVRVTPFLPCGNPDGKGFQGFTSVQVTKKVFLETANHLLENLEARGAHIELSCPTEDFESFYI